MKYEKPDLEIVEFEDDVITSIDVGASNSNSTEGNGESIVVPDDMWGL